MGITRPGNLLQAHYGRYTTQLYLSIAMWSVGILFGVLAVGTLTTTDKLSLISYIHNFLNIEVTRPTFHGVFKPALAQNLKLLGLLYLLGVSVAGMPLILVLLFFRGFVLGFSVAFLIGTLSWQGFWLSVIAVFLQNIFIVPALLIVAAVALGFSWELISPKTRFRRESITQGFVYFTGLVVVMGLAALIGTAIEAYVAPFLLHLLGNWGV